MPNHRCWLIAAAFLGLVSGCQTATTTEQAQELRREERVRRLADENLRRMGGEDVPMPQRAFSKASFDRLREGFKDLYRLVTGQRARDVFQKMIDPDSPDLRREAIFEIADRKLGRTDPYMHKVWAAYAATQVPGEKPDADFTVRAAAIRALNRARVTAYTPLYLKVLSNKDEHELVRLEAAKALANMPDSKAAPALARIIGSAEENKDLRIACADALRNHRDLVVAQALINVLSDRVFGLAHQARKSLVLMTGRDFRYDQAEWLRYLAQSAKPFG